jgi:hypothetical protein
MWRTAFGVLVVAHGLLTVGIWTPNPRTLTGDAPMDTSHSWLLGDARTVSLVLAVIAGFVVSAAGLGILAHQEWWTAAGLLGGVLSLVRFGLFFTPWWAAAIAISAALIVVAIRDGIVA